MRHFENPLAIFCIKRTMTPTVTGDATIEKSPFHWESVSSGLSSDVAINKKFGLFVNALDNALQIRDKLKS